MIARGELWWADLGMPRGSAPALRRPVPIVSGLSYESVVNVTQVATIHRAALEERVAALPAWVVEQVDEGLRRALSLG